METLSAEKRRRQTQVTHELWHALELATRMLERDGLAALRGTAWTDDEAETIRDACAKAKNFRVFTEGAL
jgi:hypothetical protein